MVTRKEAMKPVFGLVYVTPTMAAAALTPSALTTHVSRLATEFIGLCNNCQCQSSHLQKHQTDVHITTLLVNILLVNHKFCYYVYLMRLSDLTLTGNSMQSECLYSYMRI